MSEPRRVSRPIVERAAELLKLSNYDLHEYNQEVVKSVIAELLEVAKAARAALRDPRHRPDLERRVERVTTRPYETIDGSPSGRTYALFREP